VRNRAMEWISFENRVSGELYWETTQAFQADPWKSQWDFSGNGDGTLFYPGTPSKIGGSSQIPVASIRLKMIREGMEDYEYLKLLTDLGDGALAREIAAGLFPHAYQTEASPTALMAARERIAKRILELTKSTPAPGTGTGTDPGTDPGTGSGGTGSDGGSGPVPGPQDPTPPGAVPLQGGGCNGGAAGGLVALAGLLGAVRVRRRSR
jgi:hypothetical protein